jgi:hypothetical protein
MQTHTINTETLDNGDIILKNPLNLKNKKVRITIEVEDSLSQDIINAIEEGEESGYIDFDYDSFLKFVQNKS